MLQKEVDFYETHLEDLLSNDEGQFVLIKGEEIIGIFDSENAAYTEGLEKLGNCPFLIRRIGKLEEQRVTLPAYVLGLTDASI